MSITDCLPFVEIWCVDFEYYVPSGERPRPLCMVAIELRSGREIRLWEDELVGLQEAPFPAGDDALFVAYSAPAEFSCFLKLGWRLPGHVIDLLVEFRLQTNGLDLPCGRGLLSALQWYKLDRIGGDEKQEMRDLAMRGGEYTPAERTDLIEYCATDVVALQRLLPAMLPDIIARRGGVEIAIGQALLRGRYTRAVGHMEHTGIPIDMATLASIRAAWGGIKTRLIAEVDARYGVYDGTTFKEALFARYLSEVGIPWPRLSSGRLALDENTFREQAKSWPQLKPLHELRHSMGELRLERLAVGSDGRNRCSLFPFMSRTGRNQPSTAQFLFGPATWVRGLLQPGPGRAVAYVDFSSQEIGIAAALSGDARMIEAYQSGDVYLAFAKQAGLAPPDATKASHGEVRDRCKAVVLGTLYGMGAETLARRIGCLNIEARDLLRQHRDAYRRFWDWSDDTVASASLNGSIATVFGWRYRLGPKTRTGGIMNFPMQANGAEMLRLACCLATEAGIQVCAPIHDAILIEAPAERIGEDVTHLQSLMASASSIVLNGVLELGSDVNIIRWPDRYSDPRGKVMWETVARLVAEVETGGSLTTASA
jgi:DNA polymerase-1